MEDPHIVRRLATAVLLATASASLLLGVPALRRVFDEIGHLTPSWLATAIALELASCVSFVVIFRRFFDLVPRRAARQLAWTEIGSGALVPGGGVGALAVGGWLMHLAGMSTKRIVERSSGLFFLTSATNVAFLFSASGALAVGIATGPHDFVRAGLPVIAAVAVTTAVLALPPLMRHDIVRPRGRAAVLRELVVGIIDAERALLRPSWRLLGAIGYLGFDIAVLWATSHAVGYTPAAAPLIVAYIIGYLANLVPVPGGIGVLEGGLAGTLMIYGAPGTQAVAAVLVYHAVAFWLPSLGGLLAYLLLRRRLADIRADEDDAELAVGRDGSAAAPRSDLAAKRDLPTLTTGGHSETRTSSAALAWRSSTTVGARFAPHLRTLVAGLTGHSDHLITPTT